MSDYLPINNYSSLGKLSISKKAIAAIVEKSVFNLTGATPSPKKGKKRLFTIENPLRISITGEGKIRISVDVALPGDSPVKDICLKLQKEIATNLSMMIEAVPNEIHVHVVSLA